MSSTVDVEVGSGLLQHGVPVEVGIGSTAGEASLMTVVVFKTVTVPSQSTTVGGGGGGSPSGHLDRCRYRFGGGYILTGHGQCCPPNHWSHILLSKSILSFEILNLRKK